MPFPLCKKQSAHTNTFAVREVSPATLRTRVIVSVAAVGTGVFVTVAVREGISPATLWTRLRKLLRSHPVVSDTGGRSKTGQSRSTHILRKMASFASSLSRPLSSVIPSSIWSRPRIWKQR